MTCFLFTYTDWQAKFVAPLEQILTEHGERLIWIGRRSKPIDSPTIRGIPYGNPFKKLKQFEADGPLPILDDPIAFENAHLSDYAYQMSRYSKGYASRPHRMERFHEYRDHFHLTARRFKRLINREGVTSLLFMNMPHTGDDFLLYRVAETMGIRVSILMVSPFDKRFFSTNSIEAYGRINRAFDPEPVADMGLDMLEREVKETVRHYMWGTYRQEKHGLGEIFFALRTLIRQSPRSFTKPIHLKRAINEIIRLQRGLKSRSRTRREIGKGQRARAFLDWIGTLEKNPEALPKAFIYAPLHFQPEMTTAPQGGIYGDQALLLEALQASLPQDLEIVAKENPMQGGYHREKTFTDRLRQTNRVTVVHPTMDNQGLAATCSAVATVTGTAGWEAICNEKPCICFGLAWYRDCPGVHQFVPGMDISDVIANPPRRDTSEPFLRDVISRSHEGIIYEFYLKDEDAAFETENASKVIDTMRDLLLSDKQTSFA